MILEDILANLNNTKKSNIYLYFILRTLKEGIKKSSKMIDKYDYLIYQIDINDDVRYYLYDNATLHLTHLIKKKTTITEYEIISDDTEQWFTYPLERLDASMAFSDVINNQLKIKSEIPKVQDLDEILSTGTLWSYCIGFEYEQGSWIYLFRKVLASKVATEKKKPFFKNKKNMSQYSSDIPYHYLTKK